MSSDHAALNLQQSCLRYARDTAVPQIQPSNKNKREILLLQETIRNNRQKIHREDKSQRVSHSSDRRKAALSDGHAQTQDDESDQGQEVD